jgi:phosphoesterase RecJ-like protein
MINKEKLERFSKEVEKSEKVLILQPDVEQVDPDSIRSALAVGGLLEGLGKEVVYYLSGDLPKVFQIIPEVKKFTQDFPKHYGLSILVDCGGPLGQMPDTIGKFGEMFRNNPFVIIDHHANRKPVTFATIDLIEPESVATSEVLYEICKELGWKISPVAAEHMIWSILSDSGMLRLANRPETLEILGDLARISKVSISEFYLKDQEIRKLPYEFFRKKVALLDGLEFYLGSRLAILFISKEVDRAFKDAELDGPSNFLRSEMREIKGLELQIILVENEDGSYRASARSSDETAAASKIALHFGGGGHSGAAGFMVLGKSHEELRREIIEAVKGILNVS